MDENENQNKSKRIRTYAGTIGIIILLAGMFGFYYLKYVPERRSTFNRAAFQELNQIERALEYQNQAYHDALQNLIHQPGIDTVLNRLHFIADTLPDFDEDDKIGSSSFRFDDASANWRLNFPVCDPKGKINSISKNADTLMAGLFSTYKDVFDGCLLIDDQDSTDDGAHIKSDQDKAVHANGAKNKIAHDKGDSVKGAKNKSALNKKHNGKTAIDKRDHDKVYIDKVDFDKGEIIFQTGILYLSFPVDPDSLLNQNGGFSLTNMRDVTIEGNSYKLFLYPFEMGSQRLILAGLISDSKYREASQQIPFNLISLFIVLVLLFLIHLPILKIYILGPNERIRGMDIRLIIGSYFIAAFFGFFLFTKIFLGKEQAVQNRNHLEKLSDTIINNFRAELDSINRQLSFFDETFDSMVRKYDSDLLTKKRTNLRVDSTYLSAMSGPPDSNATIRLLDSLFKPRIYPYPEGVFWTNSNGKWVARWGFKKALTRAPMIKVGDRQYFKDFKAGETLLIPGIDDPITIQPTLSRLEGDYVVTVAKKTKATPYSIRLAPPKTKKAKNDTKLKSKKDTVLNISPFMIGLTSKMHSVSNVIMPPGYGFSIIDASGNIQYDSKPGRPLLSNIFQEIENFENIQQSAIYRNKRYFEDVKYRGKDLVLLSAPIDGTPYQLLVHYNLFRTDGFEEHLIELSAGLMAVVICLVILSNLINAWSKTKNRMIENRSHHFEWLHPSAKPLKQKYYRHLIRWMLLLFGVYLVAWISIEGWKPDSEFSLLFISLLFPFYIAIYYYELRERFYDVQENRRNINWYYARPSLALRCLLLVIIILINCFISFVKSPLNIWLPALVIQFIWVLMILLSTFRFRHFMMKEKYPGIEERKLFTLKKGKRKSKFAKQVSHIRTTLFVLATYQFFTRKKETEDGSQKKTLPDTDDKQGLKLKIPVSYIWAILVGVTLISIIPASGIFWLFFRQETGLYLNADQLILSKEIDQRTGTINQRMADYKFNPADSTDSSNIGRLKFSHGIYLVSGALIPDSSGAKYAPLLYPTSEYIQLHDQFFPGDSLVLAWIDISYSAADSTWFFANQSNELHPGPELLYRKRKDNINPNAFRLTADASASWNTFGLIAHSFSGTGWAFAIFFIVGLGLNLTIAFFLTLSLAKRIFLLELQQVVSQVKNPDNQAKELYELSQVRPAIQLMMLETYSDLKKLSPDKWQNIIPNTDPLYPSLKDIYQFEKKLPMSMLEARMPWLIDKLKRAYQALWEDLEPRQKFILFDFAQDGFANYKSGRDLQVLIEKGLLVFDDLRLSVMTLSFQEFVLQKKEDPDLNPYFAKARNEETWNKFQGPLLLILMAAGIFIFVTQEDVFIKITGLLTSLTSLLPKVSGLFGRTPSKGNGD